MAHPKRLYDVFVFGISGATCSGKSAVSKHLCDTLPHTVVVHQDDYYLSDHLVPRTQYGDYTSTNWDTIEAIDTTKLLEVLKTTIKNPHTICSECTTHHHNLTQHNATHTVLVEGTMILDVKELCELLHAAFFITIDYDTCKQRRDGRTYPTDIGVYVDPPGYFENVVWPEYLRTMEVASSFASEDNSFSVSILDGGKKTLSELQTDVESAIRGHLTS